MVKHAEMAEAPANSRSRKVLVTGAAGHMGANLVRRLLDDGHDVRALVQSGANNRGVEGLELERFEGDVRDVDRMREAVRGCSWVFHVAAKVSTRNATPAEEREIYAINTLGTRNMVQASLREDVERFCLTGSFSGIGVDPQDPSSPVHEDMPFYPFLDWLPYARTKALAEHETLKGVADGLDAVVAVSTGIIGPNDFLPSRTGKTLIDQAHGRLRAYIPGGSEFVSTDDMVEGHMLAMTKGKKGHRYLFSTQFMTLEEMVTHFAEVTGKPKPSLKVPVGLMLGISHVYANTVQRLFPEAPQRLTPGAIHILNMNRHADLTKAERELGFRRGDIRAAIQQAYEFFCREGMIRA